MRKLRAIMWLVIVAFLVVAAACTGEQSSDYVLIYEPDTGTRFQVTFGTVVTENAVIQAIEELGISNFEAQFHDTNSVVIKTALLDTSGREALQATLANLFGPIVNFQVTETQTPTEDQMEGAVEIIGRRLFLIGIEEPFVQRSGSTQITVQIPAAAITGSIEEIKALIGQTARLEFKERTCQTPACINVTDADLGLTGDDLYRAEVSTDQVGIGWVINLQFNDRGTEIFSDLTRRISTSEAQATKRIAIIMDDEVLLAPVARAWIRDGRTQISGNFTEEEAAYFFFQLESGRLPTPLRLVDERMPSPK